VLPVLCRNIGSGGGLTAVCDGDVLISELFLVLAFAAVGIALGVIAGLLPGLHPNNVALMLSSLAPAIVIALSPLAAGGASGSGGANFAALLVCVAIVACAVSNVFFSYLPSTFLGAPDPETALSMLPGHSMLMDGEGYKAVSLAALGCVGGVFFAFLAVVPFRFIVGSPLNLAAPIRSATPYFLIAVSLLLVLSERNKGIKRVLAAALVFALAGVFGYFVLDLPVFSPFGWATTVLFPIFTGLFGISTLLQASEEGRIPEQKTEEPRIESASLLSSVAVGSLAGAFVGFLPGLGPSQATIVASIGRRKLDREHMMVMLGAVCAADSLFALATLFIVGSARSGAMVAVSQIIPVEPWNGIVLPQSMTYLAIAVLVSAAASYFLVRAAARRFAGAFSRMSYDKISRGIIIFLVVLVWAFSGMLGLLILSVATAIGMIPLMIGVKRSHLMAVLIVPIVARMML